MWYDPNAAVVDCELILDLAGPFRLREARGVDLTPRSRKAQGLLALVGTSPCLRRSRLWLQDKLWSDRGAEQGSASLRQCLTEIRSTLRDHRGCFRTDSGWIALDPERVLVNTTVSERDEDANVEFLEGLDIRDPEFEHWLRDQRLSHSRPSDRSDGVTLSTRRRTTRGPRPAPGHRARPGAGGADRRPRAAPGPAGAGDRVPEGGPAQRTRAEKPAPPAMLCGAAYELRRHCPRRGPASVSRFRCSRPDLDSSLIFTIGFNSSMTWRPRAPVL